VLRRADDGVDPDGPVPFVLDRHLRLGVGAEPGELLRTAQILEPPHDAVREHDRQRHQLGRLIGGVAEHDPLVARPLLQRVGTVDSLGDVRRLLIDGGDDPARLPLEVVVGVLVADVADRLADHARDVHVGVGVDLPGNHHQAGGHERLARHVALPVERDDRVEDGVRDLVGHLVGVPLGDRLGGEELSTGHS